ncbi:hypothetical protein A9Q99_20610 [Gammaproteobacteria bacterium 45_16_T64]|nr:hypothetical protein A9Q99_20610 [Gammaproteobacteria bacterium 45_16_T64]
MKNLATRLAVTSSLLLFSVGGAVADTGFIILGDSGTGKDAQYRVAESMKATCETQQCDFAVGLGDNIYEVGPWSVTDAQFDKKFEAPYAELDFPFFMVLGNHDNSLLVPGDGGLNLRGYLEVSYTKHSDKWQMPKRYYSFETPANEAFFIGYDSNPPSAYLPSIFNPYFWPNGWYMKTQKSWINKELSQNDSPWKFAFAHHPYITNGHHEADGLIQGRGPYNDFVEGTVCDKVDFIFAGHEHALEILEPVESCGKTYHLVSGAAAKNTGHYRDNPTHATVWDSYESKWGYFHGQITATSFTVTAYLVDEAGVTEQAFQRTFTK